MSPWPSKRSAPFSSRMTRLSILLATWKVRLDHAGDDVGPRRLGRQEEVNSGGPGNGSHSCDAAFHVGWRGLHQIGQFVDDEYDVWQLVRNDQFALARNMDFCSRGR